MREGGRRKECAWPTPKWISLSAADAIAEMNDLPAEKAPGERENIRGVGEEEDEFEDDEEIDDEDVEEDVER